MKVVIYGTGRSGTKGLQLWIAYLLCQREKSIWLAYEPFRYQTKELITTVTGMMLHRRIPLLVEDITAIPASNLRQIEQFAQSLVSPSGSSVIKFIRANGRINLLNHCIKPDLSILVIRDIYTVLASIANQSWSLVEDQFEWQRVQEVAWARYPFLQDYNYIKYSSDKLLKNAIYWFVMNHYALTHAHKTIVVRYEDLASLTPYLQRLGLWQEGDPQLNDQLFQGNNIHKAYPLRSTEWDAAGSAFSKLLRLTDQLAANYGPKSMALTAMLERIRIKPKRIGSRCEVNLVQPQNGAQGKGTRIHVERHSLLDELASRVDEALLSHQVDKWLEAI